MKTANVITPGYDRENVTPGIIHFGVGNFHRAHEEFYTNELLGKDPSQYCWGIIGAMLLPSDERLYRVLKHQKGEYTLTLCGCDGDDKTLEIGSLKDVVWAQEDPERILDLVADRSIRIISMTITEGGYNIDKASGEFMFSNEGVEHDLNNPQNPVTVFGYVAEGLRRRRDNGMGGVTILTCDNLQHNGDTARKAFMSFFRAQDEELAEWAEKNVSFPNSMVDRITPATLPSDIERLNKKNGTEDKAPVYCEDFIQWVIEDKFVAGRPQWEAVGVEFTDDVSAYENMKLSLLNASHTLLSYPSFLAGYRKVDDAMHDDRIVTFVRDFMDKDITPYVPIPGNINLEEYKGKLIERFGNRSVSDQIARLCFDGVSKFPVYIVPNLAKMIRDGKDLTRMAYLIAVYRDYLKYHTDDNGEAFEPSEPWFTLEDKKLIESDSPEDFLSLSAFGGVDLRGVSEFLALYDKFCHGIREKGAMKTLEMII
jgi:hypothetical protein